MSVTKYPPAIHSVYNPVVIEATKGFSDPTYIELRITAVDQFINTDIKHEYFNGQVKIDISRVLADLILPTIDPYSWPLADTWADNGLFLQYEVRVGYPRVLLYSGIALNAVSQIGESSNLTIQKGRFLTKQKTIKKYSGYPADIYALGVPVGESGVFNVMFDDVVVVYNTLFRHIGMKVKASNVAALIRPHLPAFTVIGGDGWTIVSSTHFEADYNNDHQFLRSAHIVPMGSRKMKIKFNADVEFENKYRVEIWPAAVYARPPITNGLNEIEVNLPIGTDYFYMDIYGDDAASGGCIIINFEITEVTDSLPVKLMPLPENPFYVRWINRLSGYDNWMFGYRQFATKAVINQQSFAPSITDQQTQTPREVYALSGLETVRVGAQGLSQTEYDVLSNLIYSPKIEWFNEESQSWIRLSVAGSNIERDNRNILSEVEFTFNLPEPQVQF